MMNASIDQNRVSQTRRVYFVGAGISANPPTGFPLARVLVSQILGAIAPDQQTLDLLEALADPNRPSKRNPGDYIRFELLLDVIQQLADPELSVLRFVELFPDPNPLHEFCANRAIAGDIIVTTNFDCLIEKSIIKRGSQPISICTIEEFESWTTERPDRVPVYKIHGSYSRYDGSAVAPAMSRIQATLSTLTAGAKELVLPEAKREFLIEVTRGRPMTICGYSGGDDLDIVPTFELLLPASLDWLIHDQSRHQAHDATEEWRRALERHSDISLSTRDRFMRRELLEGAYPLRVYEVDTPLYLLDGDNTNPAFDSSPASDRADRRLLAFIEEWESTCLVKPHLKLLISGHILFRLARFQHSYELYCKAWTLLDEHSERSESADAARMISRVAVEISRFREAEQWSQKSDELSWPSSSSRAESLQQHGFAYYKLERFSEALKCYEETAGICRRLRLGRVLSYALHDSALIYQELSQLRRAIPLYEESIDLSARDGDIRHVMFSYHQLGTAFFDLGEFTQSQRYHLKALEIARVLGDHAQLENSEHELGMLDFMGGRLLESIRRFRRGIAMARETGRSQYVPMDLQHIGIALMEAGKFSAAGRVLLAAKENYQTINDEITLSELQSYLCQHYLLCGDYTSALSAAEAGYAAASRFGAREFEVRAAFMIGLSHWLRQNKVDGIRKICDSIELANNQEFKALLLEQLYLCAHFKVPDIGCDNLPSLVRWAISTYDELGNYRRSHVLRASQHKAL